MSALNLIPDLELLCAQTGIFLANLIVVKSLFITPYLKLQQQRREQTSGSQEKAQATLANCVQQSNEIETRIRAVISQSAQAGQSLKALAQVEQDKTLAAAKTESTAALELMRREIALQLQQESQKIPEFARQLGREFYQTLIRHKRESAAPSPD